MYRGHQQLRQPFFAHNEETSVCLCDTGFVAAMTDVFEDDQAARQPVTRQVWQRCGGCMRAQALVASRRKEQV
ncbi:hypothetical protein [Luteitalea sp.]|uniref:hypothetical protein n=1 Tax=Luteitalea sp. TaxID=2004800 RepID=UPI0037CB4E2C